MTYGSDAASKLKPAVSGDKPEVEVKKLPKTKPPETKGETMVQTSPKDHQAARRDAINRALKKAQEGTRDPSGQSSSSE